MFNISRVYAASYPPQEGTVVNASLMAIADTLFLLISFIGIPVIAGAVAFAAWRGWPKNFYRESYFLAFLGLGFAAAILILFAQRMRPEDVWHQLMQEVCVLLGLVLFGACVGCLIGRFTCRGSMSSAEPDE